MKILYVTRKYPPAVGGMETAAYELNRALQPLASVCLIKYGGANKFLPLTYPILVLRTLFTALWFRPDSIYLQDGLMGGGSHLSCAVKRSRPTIGIKLPKAT